MGKLIRMAASQMVRAPHILSPEQVLLGFLSQQPAHGYELHQRLEADLGQIWRLRLNQLYTILNRLEARGFIECLSETPSATPRRHRFELTEAGRQRFQHWLHTPTPVTVRAVRVEFTTRLYFAAALSLDLAADLVTAQIDETHQGLARLQALLAALPDHQPFNRLGLRLRVRTLASLLEWFEECRHALGLPSASATGGEGVTSPGHE